MRHAGGGPYAPQNSAEIRLQQELLECTCFVSKCTCKFNTVLAAFTGKEKTRIWDLMMMTLPKSPFLSKLHIEYNIILKYLCRFMIASSNEFKLL